MQHEIKKVFQLIINSNGMTQNECCAGVVVSPLKVPAKILRKVFAKMGHTGSRLASRRPFLAHSVTCQTCIMAHAYGGL
jgi:hypothetical protein